MQSSKNMATSNESSKEGLSRDFKTLNISTEDDYYLENEKTIDPAFFLDSKNTCKLHHSNFKLQTARSYESLPRDDMFSEEFRLKLRSFSPIYKRRTSAHSSLSSLLSLERIDEIPNDNSCKPIDKSLKRSSSSILNRPPSPIPSLNLSANRGISLSQESIDFLSSSDSSNVLKNEFITVDDCKVISRNPKEKSLPSTSSENINSNLSSHFSWPNFPILSCLSSINESSSDVELVSGVAGEDDASNDIVDNEALTPSHLDQEKKSTEITFKKPLFSVNEIDTSFKDKNSSSQRPLSKIKNISSFVKYNNIECPICSNVFTSSSNLKIHLAKFHSKESSRLFINTSQSNNKRNIFSSINLDNKDVMPSDKSQSQELNFQKPMLYDDTDDESSRLATLTDNNSLLWFKDILWNEDIKNLSNAWLCSNLDYIFNISGSEVINGCNHLQMLLSSLIKVPSYLKFLLRNSDSPMIPSQSRILEILERAFSLGWSAHLDFCRHNKNIKKLGANEASVFLSYLGVDCQLFYFHHPTHRNGHHIRLLNWIIKYFTQDKPNYYPFPLILEFQQKINLVIGVQYQKTANEWQLLSIDFARCRENANLKFSLSLIKRESYLMAPKYELLAIFGLMNLRQYKQSKIVQTYKIP